MEHGERFYYNDGHIFPMEEQDVISAMELRVPSSVDFAANKADILLELITMQQDSEDLHIVYLTRNAVENIVVLLNNVLGEKKSG